MEALIDLFKDIIAALIIGGSAYYIGRNKLQAQHDEDVDKLKNDYKLKLIETKETAIKHYIKNLPDDERSEQERLIAFIDICDTMELLDYTIEEGMDFSPATHEWKVHVRPWIERLHHRMQRGVKAVKRFREYS